MEQVRDRLDSTRSKAGERDVSPRPVEGRRVARDDVEGDPISDMADAKVGDQVEVLLEPAPMIRQQELVSADPPADDGRRALDAGRDDEINDGWSSSDAR